MANYTATVTWTKPEGAPFTDNKYSRLHEWTFDGGVTVRASSAPSVVPVPLSATDAVDPEEAFIASLSSCHMLFFLFFAAKGGFVVNRYSDSAVGEMGKNAAGKTAMVKLTLDPEIEWGGDAPTGEQLTKMHHQAHDACFIANSVTTEIVFA